MEFTGNAKLASFSNEYKMILGFYDNGVECAKRSGVPKINHINEGLLILQELGASVVTMKAFCIHPIFQDDETCQSFVSSETPLPLDWRAVALAMEYRNAANAYLCCPETDFQPNDYLPGLILNEVKDMLIADKVQNKKDFVTYHQGTHPRSKQLTSYFDYWLMYLQVSDKQYANLCLLIDAQYPSETAYLLSSTKNAERLQQSMDELK